MGLLVLFCLCLGIAITSAVADSEIENDLMQMAPSPLDTPSHLEKQDIPAEDTSFLERFWSSLFPSHKQTHRTTTHMPPFIIWRFRFFLVRNDSNELLATTTEGATIDNGDQNLVQKIEPTNSSSMSTEKNTKSSRRKRNKDGKVGQLPKNDKVGQQAKEDKVGQLSKRLALHSYMNIADLENYGNTEGQNLHKKLISNYDKKFTSINGISPNYNRSSNSTLKHCYRRFYTYLSTDWSALFIHILTVLFFILMLTIFLVSCQSLVHNVQAKRAKLTPLKKNGKPKAIEYYTVC